MTSLPVTGGVMMSGDRRTGLYLVLAAGVVVAAVYFGVSRAISGNGHVAVPQLDSLLYYQYARALAEGHPYRFNADDPPGTGSTSHLYPALLGVLYAAGFKGQGLWDAGFALNGVLYLLFVAGIYRAAREIEPRAALFAGLCAALNGHAAAIFFGQTDMGLFASVFIWSWIFLLQGYVALAAALMFLAPVVRPEGALMAAALIVAGLLPRQRAETRRIWPAAAAGVLGCVVVAAINYTVGGSVFFDSLRGKSVFSLYPLGTALIAFSRNVAELIGAVLVGTGGGGRSFYTLPLIGLLLGGVVGLRMCQDRRWPLLLLWPLLVMLLGLLVVAQSDWIGLALDRYLVWIVAMVILWLSVGCYAPYWWIADEAKAGLARRMLQVVLSGWLAAGAAWHLASYAAEAARTTEAVSFAETAAQHLPQGARVGMTCNSGLAYLLEGSSVVNISGITSPQFQGQGHILAAIEWLKYHPEERFAYWLIPEAHSLLPWLRPLLGEEIVRQASFLGSEDRMGLYRADWSVFEREGAMAPLADVGGWDLVARVDAGYRPDELVSGFHIFVREPGLRLEPVFVVGQDRQGRRTLEVGRFVLGSARLKIPVRVGQALKMVIRTAGDFTVAFYGGQPRMELREVHLRRRLELLIATGSGEKRVVLDLDPHGRPGDYVIEFPPEMVRSSPLTLQVIGDHLALAYWFYQPAVDSSKGGAS